MSHPDTMAQARLAEPTELADVVGTLALAFLEDPVFLFLLHGIPEERRLLLLTTYFGARLAGGRCSDLLVLPRLATDKDCQGRGNVTPAQLSVACWEPPGSQPDKKLSGMVLVAALGEHAKSRLAAVRVMFEHRPQKPHWYLAYVGTRLGGRQKGFASAVIAEITRRADEEGMPCYLESSNILNVPLYERHGFRTIDTVYVGDSADVPVPLMWREPGPGSSSPSKL
jgi:GNAT superfamily N-acetyltransferase